MDAVGASAAGRGERVLRVAGAETERWISYAGLADLLGQVPVSFLADLPDPQRAAVNAVLLRGPSSGGGSRARLARRLAWQALLERCAAEQPVLLLIDDAQWLDAASADVIGHAARRVDGRRVRAVIAERWPDRDNTSQPTGPVSVPAADHWAMPQQRQGGSAGSRALATPPDPRHRGAAAGRGRAGRTARPLPTAGTGRGQAARRFGRQPVPGPGAGRRVRRPAGDRLASAAAAAAHLRVAARPGRRAAGRGARDAAAGGAGHPADDRAAAAGRPR